MRFIADVNVSRLVVARLRSQGFDIVRVPELMDARASDVEIIAEARRRSAIVISHDQDFTSILALSGEAKPSLINVRVSYVDDARLAHNLASAIRAAELELEAGAIVTLDDSAVRIHRLPIA